MAPIQKPAAPAPEAPKSEKPKAAKPGKQTPGEKAAARLRTRIDWAAGALKNLAADFARWGQAEQEGVARGALGKLAHAYEEASKIVEGAHARAVVDGLLSKGWVPAAGSGGTDKAAGFKPGDLVRIKPAHLKKHAGEDKTFSVEEAMNLHVVKLCEGGKVLVVLPAKVKGTFGPTLRSFEVERVPA